MNSFSLYWAVTYEILVSKLLAIKKNKKTY